MKTRQTSPKKSPVADRRALAHQAVRACCARRDVLACMLTAEQALEELKDMSEARLPHRFPVSDDEYQGVQWYKAANARQRALFRCEWRLYAHAAQAEEFARLHQEGAARFGTDWLAMNVCITEAARQYGMSGEQTHAQRTLFSALAFRCCETFARKTKEIIS